MSEQVPLLGAERGRIPAEVIQELQKKRVEAHSHFLLH